LEQEEWGKILKEGKSLMKKLKKVPVKSKVVKYVVKSVIDYIEDDLMQDVLDHFDFDDPYTDEFDEIVGYIQDVVNKINKIK